MHISMHKKEGEQYHLLYVGHPQGCIFLFVLSLTSGLALLFASNRRLFVMLSFSYFLDDAIARSLALKSAKCAIKRFIFFNSNLTHYIPSLRS